MKKINTNNVSLENFVYKQKPLYRFIKRAFDIFASFFALVILAIPLLIVALIIKLDGGPAIFSQDRVGRDGKVFKMYKFRSMCVGADSPEMLEKLKELNEMDGPAFKITDDPRITKFGKIIRKLSIDELPQLFNILKGDMSVVGPRPALVSEVEQYNDFQMKRLLVKQGLTCYWQCSGRNQISFDEWIKLDVKYVMERGLRTDLKIILKTIPAVLSGKGAS